MNDLYIIGAGGLGRKVFECCRRINEIHNKWNIIGFLDDNKNALDGIKCNLSIVETMEDFTPKDGDRVVLAISNPDTKENIVKKFKEKGCIFESIVSPEAIVGDFVDFGEGSVVMTPYNIESGAKIGKFVTILGSTIALDGVIGDYSTSTGFVNLTNAKIGKKVFIGSHAVILENTEVGDNAEISAGAVVMNNVEKNTVVFGMPARVLKKKEKKNEE
ncbi:hypothetical protein [Aerococcus viridans]|uniref:PglD-related sugar-binding protein n=1 Tax=Aerococcus viridans TaxID=1377 RepID=UPI0039AEE4C4